MKCMWGDNLALFEHPNTSKSALFIRTLSKILVVMVQGVVFFVSRAFYQIFPCWLKTTHFECWLICGKKNTLSS